MNNFRPGSYVAVPQRRGMHCAVDFSLVSADIGISAHKAAKILSDEGFRLINVSLAESARALMGISKYKVGAISSMAPGIVNCRTIIKWLYGKKGIWLPPRFNGLGMQVDAAAVLEGDLVFVSDPRSPSGGHVGMVSDKNTVIHANYGVNLTEDTFRDFTVGPGISIRSIRRIMVNPALTETWWCPPKHDVEWSNDIYSLIRRKLHVRK